MKEELTREVLEAMKRCEYPRCGLCSLYGEKCCKSIKTIITNLSSALLEEMDKPKVWAGAPENAHTAMVVWFGEDGSTTHSQDFTRELPKTRARKNAEELYKILCFQRTGKTDCINAIESALEKYAEELKG